MLEISSTENGDVRELKLAGRLDVKTAKQADEAFETAAADGKNVVLDFSDLVYIASAGLRALKRLRSGVRANGGTLKIKNVQDNVMDVFEITGFAAMLDFE
jgi:anti-sigma B factor antagonist